MHEGHFINANPATIMQRLYQIKAEQDGEDIVIIAHAEPRERPEKTASASEGQLRERECIA